MALKLFRDNLKHLKWVLWGVVGVFIAFIFFDWGGARSAATRGEDFAAMVGDQKVTFDEFQQQYKNLESYFRQNFGDQFNQDLAKQLNLHRQALNMVIDRKILLREAKDIGLRVSNDEVRDQILSYPAFTDEDGRFVGKEKYLRALRRARMTPDQFEDTLRDELLEKKLSQILLDTAYVSDAELETAYREDQEKAKIRYVELPASELAGEVTVEPAELETYYDEHKADYERPEQRVVDYLFVDAVKLRQEVEIADAEIQEYYDQHKADFTREEQVRARQILRRTGGGKSDEEVEAEVAALRRRIEGGEDFAALAREQSQDPASAANGGTMPPFGRQGSLPEIVEAAFGAEPGQLVGPIKSAHGYHLIQVLGKSPGGVQPLDEVRAIVRSRLLGERVPQLAEAKIQGVARRIKAQKLTTVEQLQALADEEGLKLEHTDPIGQNDMVTGIGFAPAFNTAAFELQPGAISDPVQLNQRGWAILRLAEVRPPSVPELAEVEDDVRRAVVERKSKDLAMARLAERRETLEQTGGLDALAAELHVQVQESGEFGRRGTITGLGSPHELIDAALSLDTGAIGGPFETAQGAVLFEVTDRTVFDPQAFAEEKEATRERAQSERYQQLRAALLERRRQDLEVRYSRAVLEKFDDIGATPANPQG